MRSVCVLWFVALLVLASAAEAQPQSGGQDSSLGSVLRPRRDTYIIVPFPSPARLGQTMTIQYYNHVTEQTSLRIVDIMDREVQVLQEQKTVTPGIHPFEFHTNLVATGTYFIRLTRYTADGTLLDVQDSRFIVLH